MLLLKMFKSDENNLDYYTCIILISKNVFIYYQICI